jgi:hypothetical protein
MPALPFRDASAPALSSRLSISVSTRDTKNDATEAMPSREPPLATRFSSPAR